MTTELRTIITKAIIDKGFKGFEYLNDLNDSELLGALSDANIPFSFSDATENMYELLHEMIEVSKSQSNIVSSSEDKENISDDNALFYAINDHDNSNISHLMSGKIEDDKFSGIVSAYVGGGEHDEWYILNNKFLPMSYKDGEAIEYDTAANLLNLAIGDDNFIDDCRKTIMKYTTTNDTDPDEYVLRDKRHGDGSAFYVTSIKSFTPMNFGNTTFENGSIDSYSTLEEFINEEFDFESLIKRELMQQSDSDIDGKLDSSELIELSIQALYKKFGDFFPKEKTTEYIQKIVDDIEDREKNISNVGIDECAICTSCNEVLLPDDECYESHDGKALCDGCSILCEGCDKYYTDKEGTDEDGYFVCKNCSDAEARDANKEVQTWLLSTFTSIGCDKPNNFDKIVDFIVDDLESADHENFHSGDFAIGFRRFLQNK